MMCIITEGNSLPTSFAISVTLTGLSKSNIALSISNLVGDKFIGNNNTCWCIFAYKLINVSHSLLSRNKQSFSKKMRNVKEEICECHQ
jgi:hypothetical protein